jgi:hypothetical protein
MQPLKIVVVQSVSIKAARVFQRYFETVFRRAPFLGVSFSIYGDPDGIAECGSCLLFASILSLPA